MIRKGRNAGISPFSYCIINTIKTLPIKLYHLLCFCLRSILFIIVIRRTNPYFPGNFILAKNYLLFIFTAVNTSFPRFLLVKHLLTKNNFF